MKLAMDKVISKEMTVRAASARYAVPKSTLGDRVKNLLEGKEATAKPCCSDNKGTFSRTFDRDQEEILYNHVKALDSQLMPLSKPEFFKLAYKLAKKLKIKNRFNKETRMAGKDFYYDFMNRHLYLRLRTAESTSLQSAVGFSKDKVNIFFDKLTELMEKYNFEPSRIFNADETGVSCVHNSRLKVMSVKGKKQVGKLTSRERGRNVTVLLSINAAGDQFIPPLFVFPRVRIDNDLKKDAPPGSTFDAQMSGWITKDGFLKWLKAFILAQISPLPSTSSVKYKIRENRSEKSEILTSTPYKNMLVEKKALIEEKKAKEEQRIKIREIKRKIKKEKDNAHKSNADKQKIKHPQTRKLASNAMKLVPRKRLNCNIPSSSSSRATSPSTVPTSSEITNCIICGESFDEDWIQCNTCKGWAHEQCANVEDTLFYHCDLCKKKK
ncbi:hypothetical protein J437_LFUL017387 [Ladona fulva]|uniref:Zinc finger PHD-type domain-containing protein n=1 Tax=Ladona fulva TaxID=123851 RepID=A0A8K0KQL6_LADFU|nr:hypothetical protein J437_LFUL017387 [Ladona fulva]